MTGRPSGTSDGAGDLRRSIDDAVRRAWCGRVLAAVGCWIATAVAIVVALAAIDVAGAGRLGIAPLPVAVKVPLVLAVAAVPTAAMLWRRVSRDGWPSRIGIALATEARIPRLGESLSRAVDFLDEERPGSPPVPPAALGFRRLAIEQAAAAQQEAGGFVVPRFAADAGWAAVGLAAVLAASSSTTWLPKRWADAMRRQVATLSTDTVAEQTTADGDADEPLPREAQLAAARLAATAAIERRLADLLATRFARAPGLTATTLAPKVRRELDSLAAVPAECQREIDATRRLLMATASASATPAIQGDRLRRAIGQLEPLDEHARMIAADIAANRLRRAADATLAVADTIAAAATTLGAVADLPPPQAASGPLAVAAAALDRSLAADAALAPASPHDELPTGVRPDDAATTASAGPTNAGSVAATGGSGGAAENPAGAGRDAQPQHRPRVPDDAAPIEQVWSLLPAGERQRTAREALELVPPAYRPAIDTYYRLLLQSSSDARPASAPERSGPRPQPTH